MPLFSNELLRRYHMSKHKSKPYVVDDDFFAQVDFLRNDYDQALKTMEQLNADIRQLLSILIRENIPVPEEMIDKYVLKFSKNKDSAEELPFNKN